MDRSHSIFLLFALHLSLSFCYADEFVIVVVVDRVMAVFFCPDSIPTAAQ